MYRTRGAAVAAALIVIVAMAATACGNGESSDKDLDALNAIQALDKAGLHDIDTSINEKGQVPATAQATALHMQALVKLTKWPTSDLQKQGDGVAAAFGEMAAAVAAGDKTDMKQAGAAAKKVHDAEHDFSHKVWEHLQSRAGIKQAGSGAH